MNSMVITSSVSYYCLSSSLNSQLTIIPNFNSHSITLKRYKPHQTKISIIKEIINQINLTCSSSMADSNLRVSLENDGDVAHKGMSSVGAICSEIIVVRHGETDWNALGKMQGQLDVELNEAGRQQAVAVADRLSREPNISAVYSSDLKRALETAKIIAASCGELEVIQDPDLRERHLGDLQGHIYQELPTLATKAYEAFKSSRLDQEIPGGGESIEQLQKRCTFSLQRISEKHKGQRVVVVSHGGAIRSMFNHAAAKGQSPGKILNTSVGIIQLSEGGVWSIKSWNDASHLSQTGFLNSAFGGDASSA